ncbi:MAG TPA: FliH/SctL family protein, partial [Polyangiales bacterium]|nr:FliH/SctL family protein [Polyangiales bacterium]
LRASQPSAAERGSDVRELLSLAADRARVLREAERDVQRAVLLVASKLAQRELSADPDLLAQLIEPLLARVRRAGRVRLHLHPEDARALGPRLTAAAARAELQGVLEVAPDAGLERGGCVIESSLGELDARLSTRLEVLGRELGWEVL